MQTITRNIYLLIVQILWPLDIIALNKKELDNLCVLFSCGEGRGAAALTPFIFSRISFCICSSLEFNSRKVTTLFGSDALPTCLIFFMCISRCFRCLPSRRPNIFTRIFFFFVKMSKVRVRSLFSYNAFSFP